MAAVGRPRKEISAEQFEKLCGIQCTLEEIASFFDCSQDTIERWCQRTYQNEDGSPMCFADAYKVFSVNGKISLRRFQFKQAEKSYAMAIWLGKQWLGQREVVEAQIPQAESAVEQIAKMILKGKDDDTE